LNGRKARTWLEIDPSTTLVRTRLEMHDVVPNLAGKMIYRTPFVENKPELGWKSHFSLTSTELEWEIWDQADLRVLPNPAGKNTELGWKKSPNLAGKSTELGWKNAELGWKYSRTGLEMAAEPGWKRYRTWLEILPNSAGNVLAVKSLLSMTSSPL